jgi:hypothetical protein
VIPGWLVWAVWGRFGAQATLDCEDTTAKMLLNILYQEYFYAEIILGFCESPVGRGACARLRA